MLSKFYTLCALAVVASAFSSHDLAAESDAALEARLAKLEARVAELEARLAETEQETKEVKVLASSSQSAPTQAAPGSSGFAADIMARSAWRNYRWTEPEQWDGIQKGITIDRVVELLGEPPRTVKSLKPRIDLVYYYETSLKDTFNSVRGKVNFKDGIVVSAIRPDFEKLKSPK
ncbi:MAG: carbohydrate porin [Verrucomicrobiota bacterium]